MIKKKIFLASSVELEKDRNDFEIFINRKNKEWVDRGVFLELVMWEDFLDAVSRTRLQDEYNQAVRECDIFVMLFHTKVGQYTEEEFETAFGQFRATSSPFIFTYFKDVQPAPGHASKADLDSLQAFKDKLKALGHYYTRYSNIDALKLHFSQQLEKLAASEFVEFKPDKEDSDPPSGDSYHANLSGSGAIAQGKGANAVGAGGILIGGNNTGEINTGTKIDTGGGAYVGGNVNTGGGNFVGRDKITHGLSPAVMEQLFAPLLAVVARQVPPDKRVEAMQLTEALRTEVAKGEEADGSKIKKIIDGLIEMVPGAIGTVVSLFTTPVLKNVAGEVTKYLLEK